jgi:hypothetical protein
VRRPKPDAAVESLPRLFFDYLGQGFKLRAKPIKMLFVSFVVIAALKAGLELTAEQEKNWPAVEAAIRDMAKARADRVVARANEQPPSDPVEDLHRRAERLGTVATGLKKLADAEEPLY